MTGRLFYWDDILSGTDSKNYISLNNEFVQLGTYSAVNRLISTSSCVATVVFFKLALFSFKKKQESLNSIIDIVVLASSILAGNASVAACGGEINQTSALIIGIVGGFIYTLSNYGMQRF